MQMKKEEYQKIADTEEYADFESRHNRHLNMLADGVSIQNGQNSVKNEMKMDDIKGRWRNSDCAGKSHQDDDNHNFVFLNTHANFYYVFVQDRNIRRQALNEFKKAVNNTKNDKILIYFYRERLCKRLVLCLEDQVEKNRELSIEIITV